MTNTYFIKTVETQKEKMQFHSLPRMIYADYPAWIEAPHADCEALFAKELSLIQDGAIERWIVYKNQQPVGRIVAFTHSKLRVGSVSEKNGGLGFFECVDDSHAAYLLFKTAERWLEQFNVQKIYGPIHPAEKDSYWGLLVEGFDKAPGFRKNFHARYYKKLFEANGYVQEYQQYSYHRPLVADVPEFLSARIEQNKKNSNYTFCSIKNIPEIQYQEHILNIYNESWGKTPGFKVLTPEQNRRNFKKLKTVINKDFIWLAFQNQKAVGFAIFMPEISEHIKDFNGRWSFYYQLKLLLRLKLKPTQKAIGLGFGVLPEHQGTGLSQMLAAAVGGHIRSLNVTEMELNWIGGFNKKMLAFIESFGAVKSKTHITFSKTLELGA